MKKFKINYLVRYFDGAEIPFTHTHNFFIIICNSREECLEFAFNWTVSKFDEGELYHVKSLEIGENEEVTNES